MKGRKFQFAKRGNSEEKEHIAFVHWLKLNGYPVMHFNNAPRNEVHGHKLKLMGLMKGSPDIFVPVPTESFSGLFIEMKRANGGIVSPEQAVVIEMLNKLGYYATICFGVDDAINTTRNYMRNFE